MDCACAKPGKRLIVRLHRVALVLGEAIAGMTRVEYPHHRIALDFRKDGSGCDAGRFGVAFDDRLLGDGYLLQPLRVDQQMLRRRTQPWTARCIACKPAQ